MEERGRNGRGEILSAPVGAFSGPERPLPSSFPLNPWLVVRDLQSLLSSCYGDAACDPLPNAAAFANPTLSHVITSTWEGS